MTVVEEIGVGWIACGALSEVGWSQAPILAGEAWTGRKRDCISVRQHIVNEISNLDPRSQCFRI